MKALGSLAKKYTIGQSFDNLIYTGYKKECNNGYFKLVQDHRTNKLKKNYELSGLGRYVLKQLVTQRVQKGAFVWEEIQWSDWYNIGKLHRADGPAIELKVY